MNASKVLMRGGLIVLALGTVQLCGGCKEDRSELRGQLAFVDRGDDGQLALFVSAADGEGKRLVFTSTDAGNDNVLYPRWSKDGRSILVTGMRDAQWVRLRVDPETGAATPTGEEVVLTANLSRAEGVEVREGSVFYVGDRGEEALFKNRGFDLELSPGASEVAWGPGKRHVVFHVCGLMGRCEVRVARADGSASFVITTGQQPDWRP